MTTNANSEQRIARIQEALRERGLDAWLFYDHHHRDPIAYRVLGLDPAMMVTRRWFYLLPAEGQPLKLVHRIEAANLDSLPGRKRAYSSWQELAAGLEEMVRGRGRLAMQYSPQNAIPYIGLVDAGTVELLRSLGAEVVTSADLVQLFEACWSPEALDSHKQAGRIIDEAVREAFAEIGRRGTTDEYTMQRFILGRLESAGLFTDEPPIVAVNQNAGNPHYEPRAERTSPIRAGDLVLLDVWAKLNRPGAVYYDVTWMGFYGASVPEQIRQVWEIVRGARDTGVSLVAGAVRAGRPIHGFEVDQAVRAFITDRGYGPYFTHRTGHSIGETVHANGANIDSLETRDERLLIPHTCFSIEPGIYLPEFGVRSEVNVYVGDNEAGVTGAIQQEIIRIQGN